MTDSQDDTNRTDPLLTHYEREIQRLSGLCETYEERIQDLSVMLQAERRSATVETAIVAAVNAIVVVVEAREAFKRRFWETTIAVFAEWYGRRPK
jgi:phosphosulfolactate phosphohydrolase-like enzyme